MNATTNPVPASHWRRNRTLYLLLAVCVAPVLASYLAYFVIPPAGRTNYGDLVSPQRPAPALDLERLDGSRIETAALRGRWVMLHVDEAACGAGCRRKLWNMRQVRLTQGKDRDRIERVWLITDAAPLETTLLREYDGTLFLRANRAELEAFLALPAEPDSRLTDHIWLIDPLGNLMLRWPKNEDPNGMKKDLTKLLRASRIG
ncbi:MAG: SCO family protein [Burkholderiaceae bacterium]